MKHIALLVAALGLICLAFAPSRAAETEKNSGPVLTATTDRADALYRRGETVTFVLQLQQGGKTAGKGEVEWTLTKDGVAPTRTGRVALDGGRATVTGTLDEAGFLQCRAVFQAGATKLTALAGAGVSPTEIKPSQSVPADFDAFWTEKKQALAAVPMNPQLTPVKSPSTTVVTFDVQVESVGAPVSGYFSRPVGAKPGTLPAILTVHGAGVRSAGLGTAAGWAKEGAMAFDINAHGIPNGRDAAFYEALSQGELKDYRAIGKTSRDTVYFLGMFQRLIRAIDFLTAQPEWDGRTVVVSGSSQGGAQAIAAAGLDARVTFFAAGVPAMCDHTGALVGRIAGWPKFIATKEQPAPEVVAAVRYYDAVNFATRAKAAGIFTVGFIDTTCPPTSVYAAYNALGTKKEIFHDIAAGHTNTPAASAAMRAAIVKHLAAMKR
ncbi:acetylxylan esterase [Horticoccus sp. 23ND18S-11]|uniref:acetylxylan esterase n=1 Tax=Horticoccus sp. 23ND18S-11 TaxID=3391832 RepID=UPI0039C9C585